jgi:toxin HigB-1
MEKCCNTGKEAAKEWGDQHGRKIMAVLAQIRAAETLADVYCLAHLGCHELSSDRKGQFTVTTKQPFRLIFELDHDPVPIKPDGGVDRIMVTDIIVLEVENYHDKRK